MRTPSGTFRGMSQPLTHPERKPARLVEQLMEKDLAQPDQLETVLADKKHPYHCQALANALALASAGAQRRQLSTII